MKHTRTITLSALLIALGILIPMIMPLRVVIPPASYTFLSHVPIFIAMFLSPGIAVAVALGTAFGFLMSSTYIIALRALSHVVFALCGALYLQKHRNTLQSVKKSMIFNVVIGLIHAATECLVVTPLFLNGSLSNANYQAGFFTAIVVMIGLGGFIHSLIDFTFAQIIAKAARIT